MIEERLFNDLQFYCENNLKIKPKSGDLIPFKFNKAQQYIHDKLERQKLETGKVRAIVLKGRQQGCSTYIAGRFYHQTVTNKSILTFVFAHDADASSSLFDMVNNYYESSDQSFRPERGASNAKELLFPGIHSGYKVGTAGTKGLGRSKTFQQVHWSEVAYSPNCQEHAAGILQTVADTPGTEIILESTANGMGDYFHRMCMQASSSESDWLLIFVPWCWQDEYTRPLPKDFELQTTRVDEGVLSEIEYYEAFKKDGLTLEHMNWRRNKIDDTFEGDPYRFKREYPFSVNEAFETSGEQSFIKPEAIMRAVNTPQVPDNSSPLIFGVDPARKGRDAFKITHRKGRNVTKHYKYPPLRIDQSATRLAQDIDKYKPVCVNIDAGGLGVGVYDILVGMGYGNIVNKVDFGGEADNKEINRYMVAEMFRRAKEWFDDTPCSMSLLSSESAGAISTQLSARKYEYYRNSILVIESKDKFKEEFGYSPDDGDSFLLTFAKKLSINATQRMSTTEVVYSNTDWSPF